MPEQATITYLDNSGFCLAIGDHLLIFDYFNGDGPGGLNGGVITARELAEYARVSVFVSHSHGDHFNPAIYGWQDHARIAYFISHELPPNYPGIRLSPDETVSHEGINVRAFDSTDLGVSFLIETDGLVIFHAGDLNWWHWREESTPAEIDQAEREFKAIMEKVTAASRETPIDIAFFPLDPRQRSYYDAGASFFILSARPKLFVPMHFTGRFDILRDFVRRNHTRHTAIFPISARGAPYVDGQDSSGAPLV